MSLPPPLSTNARTSLAYILKAKSISLRCLVAQSCASDPFLPMMTMSSLKDGAMAMGRFPSGYQNHESPRNSAKGFAIALMAPGTPQYTAPMSLSPIV